MNVLVVYDTQYGNTEQVARAVAGRLGMLGTVRLAPISDGAASDFSGIDLLLIGGPTQAHGVRPSLRAWVNRLPADALQGMALAVFDTRLHWPLFLSGSAARTLAPMLVAKGAHLLVPPESFLVGGAEGPLATGERDRADAWAASLAARVGEYAAAAAGG